MGSQTLEMAVIWAFYPNTSSGSNPPGVYLFEVFDAIIVDDIYYAVGKGYDRSSYTTDTGYLWIAYYDDENNEWIAKVIDKTYRYHRGRLSYENGVILLLAHKYTENSDSTSTSEFHLYHPIEPKNVFGEWTYETIVNNLKGDDTETLSPKPTYARYINGYYIVLGQRYDESANKWTASLWYSQTIDGTYTLYDLWSGEGSATGNYSGPKNNIAYDIIYKNNEYFVVGYRADDTTVQCVIARFSSFEDSPVVTLINNIWPDPDYQSKKSKDLGFMNFDHVNNIYIISFTGGDDYGFSSTFARYVYIYVSSDLLQWINRSYSVPGNHWDISKFIYEDGKYLAVRIIADTTTSSNGYKTELTIYTDIVTSGSFKVNTIDNSSTSVTESNYVFLGHYKNKYVTLFTIQGHDHNFIYDDDVIKLPIIATEGAYNYIKALEG